MERVQQPKDYKSTGNYNIGDLRILSKVLKGYSSKEQFEKDWDCTLLVSMGNISGVVFRSDSAKTAFHLKYIHE